MSIRTEINRLRKELEICTVSNPTIIPGWKLKIAYGPLDPPRGYIYKADGGGYIVDNFFDRYHVDSKEQAVKIVNKAKRLNELLMQATHAPLEMQNNKALDPDEMGKIYQ